MKAVVITTPGGPEVLQLQEVEDPQINEDEVLVKVEATALNRADTIQRQGKYPPPKGASPYGLECSGTIEAVGKNVSRWKTGDQVIHFRFLQERNSLKWCFCLFLTKDWISTLKSCVFYINIVNFLVSSGIQFTESDKFCINFWL